jgi:hypothetical protein
MKFSLRHLIYIAVFGALWAAVEATVGAYLHVIFPPGASFLPLVGTVTAAVGVAVALTGRRFLPQAGSVLMISVVTALLKLISIGGTKLGPVLGILIEGLIAELALQAFRRHGDSHSGQIVELPFSYVLAGALAVMSTFFQKFLFAAIFLGASLSQTLQGFVKQGSSVFGLQPQLAALIVLVFLLFDGVVGGVAGLLSWQVGKATSARLGKRD